MSQVPTGYLLQSTSAFLSVFKVTVKKSLMGCQISAMWHHGWDPGTEITLLFSPLSHVQLSATPYTAAHHPSLFFTIFQNLLKLMSIELVIPSNHLILCRSLILPSIFPSIRVFSNESIFHIRWPKYWSFSFSISLSNKYSGLISFRIDWFDRPCFSPGESS